jgi:DNA repair protein RadA/Sms
MKVRTLLECNECRQQVARWVGRCPGCGGWGTIHEAAAAGAAGSSASLQTLAPDAEDEPRASTGFTGVDRVLGDGLVPGSVTLLAGEPGIGKSTLLLQVVANLSAAGHPCVLASGEESRAQVARRARRVGIDGRAISYLPGRELADVLRTVHAAGPFLLAVDSIQALRDADASSMPGGTSQVRSCTDALVGLAKSTGIAVLLTGHVTKDGDLAGPRTLEHAVDVVLTFDGDPRSGLRMLSGGKNRFGREGEVAWFEMAMYGLREIDPVGLLRSGCGEPGSATGLPLAGRRALAVDVQALISPGDGPGRRQVAGLDARRFQLVAAVLDRIVPGPLLRGDLFGASLGGVRIDDPGCDLAVAAALVSAATGIPAPPDSAFVGEVGLTGRVRPVSGMALRLAAARAAGCSRVFAAGEPVPAEDLLVIPVAHVLDALSWVGPPEEAAGANRLPQARATPPA